MSQPETPSSETASDSGFDPSFDPGVDPRLLEVLVCPVSHGSLDYDRGRAELISRQARLAYPIRDGVPIMLLEEARDLGEGE